MPALDLTDLEDKETCKKKYMEKYNSERVWKIYLDMTADVILNKNLERHLSHLNQLVSEINRAVANISGSPEKLYEIGFKYYILKDDIIRRLNRSGELQHKLKAAQRVDELNQTFDKADLKAVDQSILDLLNLNLSVMRDQHKVALEAFDRLERLVLNIEE